MGCIQSKDKIILARCPAPENNKKEKSINNSKLSANYGGKKCSTVSPHSICVSSNKVSYLQGKSLVLLTVSERDGQNIELIINREIENIKKDLSNGCNTTKLSNSLSPKRNMTFYRESLSLSKEDKNHSRKGNKLSLSVMEK